MSPSELKKRYSELFDDELISIRLYSDLLPEAKEILSREMKKRGITESDIEEASKIDEDIRTQEQEKISQENKWFRVELVIYLVFFIIVVVGVVIKAIKQ